MNMISWDKNFDANFTSANNIETGKIIGLINTRKLLTRDLMLIEKITFFVGLLILKVPLLTFLFNLMRGNRGSPTIIFKGLFIIKITASPSLIRMSATKPNNILRIFINSMRTEAHLRQGFGGRGSLLNYSKEKSYWEEELYLGERNLFTAKSFKIHH